MTQLLPGDNFQASVQEKEPNQRELMRESWKYSKSEAEYKTEYKKRGVSQRENSKSPQSVPARSSAASWSTIYMKKLSEPKNKPLKRSKQSLELTGLQLYVSALGRTETLVIQGLLAEYSERYCFGTETKLTLT